MQVFALTALRPVHSLRRTLLKKGLIVRVVRERGRAILLGALLAVLLAALVERWWVIAGVVSVAALATAASLLSRVARLEAVRESDERFRTLAETASDAIITIDEQSRIVLVNQAAETTFGYTRDELIGAELTMLMPAAFRHQHQSGLARYVQSGRRSMPWNAIELPGLHKSGREVPLEIAFGEFTRNGRRFFTGIARDITERKRVEEALRRSREERLTELERVRKRIAADLHDDVGSSLTRISLLGEVVRRQVGATDASLSEALASIAELSRELVDSMSDIVWAVNPDKDHLSDLSQRMRRFASDVFTARQIEFAFRTPDLERDVRLGANIRRELFLVFKEAVHNVVKHSACSRAALEFHASPDGLVVIVGDNGRGFDLATRNGGHGLATMRERVGALGGDLRIESRPGEGTLLAFTVPLADDTPAEATRRNAAAGQRLPT